MHSNDQFQKFQSGFGEGHNMETTLKVLNDLI